MREDFWSFVPSHKLVISTNHRPAIRGRDHGIWRRLRLIPFSQRFWDPDKPAKPGEDRPERLRADKRLTDALRSESAGILAWMIDGCLAWQQHGLPLPPEVFEATEQYRSDQDLIGEFICECCVIGTNDYKVRFADLFSAFIKWCEGSGEKLILSRKALGSELKSRGYSDYTSNGTWYAGIALRNDCGETER